MTTIEKVHRHRLADLQRQLLAQHRGEAGLAGAHFVVPRPQERDIIDAGFVRRHLALDAGVGVLDRPFGSGATAPEGSVSAPVIVPDPDVCANVAMVASRANRKSVV